MSVSQLENTQINSHVLNKDTQLEHIIVQFGNEYIKPKKKKKTYILCVFVCVCVYTNERPQFLLSYLYAPLQVWR